MKRITKTVLGTAILLVGCTPQQPDSVDELPPTSDTESSSAAEQPQDLRETPNVTYTGTIAPAGISIYQEGSHRLVLEDERFILLESDVLDLNGYVNEKVNVTGSVRPTVEEGGMLMRVENIQLQVQAETEPESPPTEEETQEPPSSPEEEQESSLPPVEEVETETGSTTSSEEPEEKEEGDESDSSASADMLVVIEAMAADDYSPERWSQPKYCTGHIGFCVPIHKNWWYKSFGNTSSDLWHLEISNQEITALGQGPIVIKLAFGSIESTNATDRQVSVSGNTVTGFRAWDSSSHFQITADKSLENPVQYLTRELSRYEE